MHFPRNSTQPGLPHNEAHLLCPQLCLRTPPPAAAAAAAAATGGIKLAHAHHQVISQLDNSRPKQQAVAT
jgi:hypothetical protein